MSTKGHSASGSSDIPGLGWSTVMPRLPSEVMNRSTFQPSQMRYRLFSVAVVRSASPSFGVFIIREWWPAADPESPAAGCFGAPLLAQNRLPSPELSLKQRETNTNPKTRVATGDWQEVSGRGSQTNAAYRTEAPATLLQPHRIPEVTQTCIV